MAFTIYCHTNRTNGKRYVGQTRGKMNRRWHMHVHTAVTQLVDTYFCNAIRKYGPEAFDHEVLETVGTLAEANVAEPKWVAFYKSNDRSLGYNMTDGGDARNQAPESRAKLSAATKARMADPVTRAACAEQLAEVRVPWTTETAKAASAVRNSLPAEAMSALAMKSHATLGAEGRSARLRKANATRKASGKPIQPNALRKWRLTDPDGCVWIVIGMTQFCANEGLSQSCMSSVAAGRVTHHKGWTCTKIVKRAA